VSEYVKVAKLTEIPDPGKRTLEVEDSVVVLFHVDGRFYCIDDVCTHDGGPLGEGRLCGHAIACPRHGAQFDIRTGQPLTMPAIVPTLVHEVKVEGEDVYVRINEA
jgi:3-phenylpropionate/trans-cinnamate dioxygenase ferredoxin component